MYHFKTKIYIYKYYLIFYQLILTLKYQNWVKPIISFIAGQGSVQILNVLTAFLLLRWVPKDEYGLFTLAFSLFSMFSLFIESGINNSIIPLIGKNIGNKQIVASYIFSASKLRIKILLFITPIFLLVYYFYFTKHNLDLIVLAGTAIIILISIAFSGPASYYAIPLIIHRKIHKKYIPEIIGAFCKISISYLLYRLDLLNFTSLVSLFLLNVLIKYFYYKNLNKSYFEIQNIEDKTSEIINYIKPVFPGIVFNAFQGQLLIILIALSGNKTDIADFGALTRLGQLFLFFNVFIGTFIGPWIAKLNDFKLKKKIFFIIFTTILFVFIISVIPYFFPKPLEIILGNKYSNIFELIPIYIFVSSINILSIVISTINMNRKFVYLRATLLQIMILFTADIFGVFLFDLSKLLSLVYFQGTVALAYTLSSLIIMFYGLKKSNY
jgi:O-antigen/teichoic acid export membrane protein